VTEASVPHLVLTAFKNLAAIGIQTGYEFAQLKGATSGAPAPAPAALTQAPAAKAAAPVKEEGTKLHYSFL
jgi:large subunit ribosomal protein LP0